MQMVLTITLQAVLHHRSDFDLAYVARALNSSANKTLIDLGSDASGKLAMMGFKPADVRNAVSDQFRRLAGNLEDASRGEWMRDLFA